MIRLTLILTAAIVGSMMVFGTGQKPLETETIAETVLRRDMPENSAPRVGFVTDSNKATHATPVAATDGAASGAADLLPQQTPEPAPPQTPALLVLEARDAPADEIANLSNTQAVPDGMLYVTGTRVNMRSGPSTNDSVVGSLRRGARAELLADTRDGWLQIRDISSGAEGYMAARFLSPLGPG